MGYLGRIIVTMLTFIGITVFLPQLLYVDTFQAALLASFILSILNVVIRPILLLLTLPFNIVTLGLFTFVINSMMLMITANILGQEHFSFPNFISALIVAVIMSVVNTIVSSYHND